jgi:hypothetical protein
MAHRRILQHIRRPVDVSATALPSRPDLLTDGAALLIIRGVWLRDVAREMTVFSEYYDFSLSLLLREDGRPAFFEEAEDEPNTPEIRLFSPPLMKVCATAISRDYPLIKRRLPGTYRDPLCVRGAELQAKRPTVIPRTISGCAYGCSACIPIRGGDRSPNIGGH